MRILVRVAEVMITGYKLERGVPRPGSGFKMKSQGLRVLVSATGQASGLETAG